jgi:hypothetical protein
MWYIFYLLIFFRLIRLECQEYFEPEYFGNCRI